MSSAQSGQGFLRVDKAPLVDSSVEYHLRSGTGKDDPSLITVTHTPNAITSHIVATETPVLPVVRMEQGRVVTKVKTEDYGTLISVVGGPAVVEVALHQDAGQRDRYRRAVELVDAEAAEHAVTAIREAAFAIIRTVGVAEQDPSDATPPPHPDDTADSAGAIWADLRYEYGPCSCEQFDDDTACTSTCALCAALPEGWPCPAWSGARGGYGPNAVIERPS